ncbi:DNA modification methylase [Desulfocicer vacuolatum DSM 3385]|uniref:Methyltransferase n=1 Tax=Desulfocicer vacuolatum DSM 3385 TaxID=1121400 RepID=A0A1W2AHL1_9BACT|nr:site-specific DNA-methyltransferase [Desulfocicer vacuolatum]SMC60104.1 DNA modification methylase [Desulfocicer vacuolatum DSM 3385]
MKSEHRVIFSDARNLNSLSNDSIDLVVTSPPYPMISMWDNLFINMNPDIQRVLDQGCGNIAFELMHLELDKVWQELDRVVKPSGFVCINIGDATRTVGKQFQLYSNHSRITSALTRLSFQSLPVILWKKATNSPNKFMGSGMLPAGAYVTLEHEYIMIFRKGGKREFKTPEQKQTRNESAIFWEERNRWFSDTWDIKGVRQKMGPGKSRDRNAAYPFELPHRLINMYSVKDDTVLDPFLGTGTTTFAAMASERNSLGVECDNHFSDVIREGLKNTKQLSNKTLVQRIEKHLDFVKEYQQNKKILKHENHTYGFPVMTKQESRLKFNLVKDICSSNLNKMVVEYEDFSISHKTKRDNVKFYRESNLFSGKQMNLFDL